MAQAGLAKSRLVILIAGIMMVLGGGIGAAYGYSGYNNLTETILRSDELSTEERHLEAIAVLQPTQDSWLVNLLGIKETEIGDRLGEFEKRVEHQSIFQQALDQKHGGEWEEAIGLLSEIPDDSFYSHRAESKISETKQTILESQLAAERTARKIAEDTAAAEEDARLLAEARAIEEARLRAIEEVAKAAAEANAREEARLRGMEEVARKAAEQIGERHRLAAAQQQRETEVQSQRADQGEKARIIGLARTNPMIKAIVSGELNFYIDPLPWYASVGVESIVYDVASYLTNWKPYGATLRQVSSANDADMTISWVKDYGSHTLGQSIYRAHIKVGLGSNNCVGEWRSFDAATVKKVLWHELGHSMGYGHSPDPNNVMYYQTEPSFAIDSEVSTIIAGGWYHTFPLCGSGTYSYSFETEDPNTGFDLYVLPPGSDPDAVSRGGARVYLGCGEEGMHRYSGTCTVANGASIYILNTSYPTAIRLSGSIISLDDPPWPEMTWDEEAYEYDEVQLAGYWALFH